MPWTSVRQVHGNTVLIVDRPLGASGIDADAIVTATEDVPIALFAADCALVVFLSAEGPIGIAHAGWKGLHAGVLERTAAAVRDLGASDLVACCSAMIHSECYEFSPADLTPLVEHFGPSVAATTSTGRPAFDVPRAVTVALSRAGVSEVCFLGGCTACEGPWYSWRARREQERHALVCWRPGP